MSGAVDEMPVYPHFSREWWLSLASALDKLGDTYARPSLHERAFRRCWHAMASYSRWRARHARPAGAQP